MKKPRVMFTIRFMQAVHQNVNIVFVFREREKPNSFD